MEGRGDSRLKKGNVTAFRKRDRREPKVAR